ncbi:MAG: hypothetical protein WC760_15010 [Bacteroidia bacterium]|jgi:hypothetical protein
MTATPQPDFLRPQRGTSSLAWVACAVALLVLAVAAVDAHDAWSARDAALLASARPPLQTPKKVDSAAQRALRQARARLDRPWQAAFGAIEQIDAPGVSWLVLDVGERGALRLEGLAPDAPVALAAAEMLRRQGAWREVVLGRLDGAPGGLQRFELVGAAMDGTR